MKTQNKKSKKSKQVMAEARKKKKCTACGTWNGPVKKVGSLKLTHERFFDSKTKTHKTTPANESASLAASIGGNATRPVDLRVECRHALNLVSELEPFVGKAGEDLSAQRVLSLFEQMSDDDCELLGLDPSVSRPESLILQRLLVPPACLRPSVSVDPSQGSTEDDLTIQLSQIVTMNNELRKSILKGNNVASIMEQWQYIQVHNY